MQGKENGTEFIEKALELKKQLNTEREQRLTKQREEYKQLRARAGAAEATVACSGSPHNAFTFSSIILYNNYYGKLVMCV